MDNKLDLQLQQHDLLTIFLSIAKYYELNTKYSEEKKKNHIYQSFQPA